MVDRLDSERLRGFCDRRTDVQTDGQTDICDSRVAFVTENNEHLFDYQCPPFSTTLKIASQSNRQIFKLKS